MKFTATKKILVSASLKEKIQAERNGVTLTKREKEILEQMAQGLSAQEVADKIFVSLDTVETHKRNIVQKLKARNTVDAVAKAIRRGLIE